jgi:hypothetical protein
MQLADHATNEAVLNATFAALSDPTRRGQYRAFFAKQFDKLDAQLRRMQKDNTP